MPYNFETTFTQPILTKLDNGLIKGARDWANTITDSYITTIQAGLPQGAPATLPAPGLNPTAPPPFPIGVSGFNTANTKRQAMYTIIYAYFYAKELQLSKASIVGLSADVKQLIIKIRVKSQQVKSYIQTIKLLEEQLKEQPKILTDIVQEVKNEIKFRVEDIKAISLSLDKFKVQIGPDEFAKVFKDELSLIDKLQNFDPTSLSGVSEIALFVSEYGKRTNPILAIDSRSSMKKYVNDKLLGIARFFLQLANGITDPASILDLVRQLSNDASRLKKLYSRLQQFDLFIRFVQPKLKSLQQKKDSLVRHVRDQLQKKLVDLRKRLEDKISEFKNSKVAGKADSLYSSASKVLNDMKAKIQKKTQKHVHNTKLLQRALKQSVTITGKVTSLTLRLQSEFSNIAKDIIAEQKVLSQLASNYIDFNSEGNKLHQHFSNIGLSAYTNLGVSLLVEANCDFQTFKRFFEKKRNNISVFAAELVLLDSDIKKLIALLEELSTGKTTPTKPGVVMPVWVNTRVKSLSDLFDVLITKIKPKLEKLQSKISKKINQFKVYAEEHLKKAAEDLKVFAINLLPLKSDVQDSKTKQQETEAKQKVMKEKVVKIKKILELGSFVVKMTKGSQKLTNNILRGDYTFSGNKNSIDMMLDGLYQYKMYDQSGPVIASLVQEKNGINLHFKSLMVIEALSYGLIETFKDMQESGFANELSAILQTLDPTSVDFKTLSSFNNLIKNPPTTIQGIKDAASSTTVGALDDARVATKILDLERKYLHRSRETVRSLCTISELEGTKLEKSLLKVRHTLDKNQSFILLAFHMLVEAIREFASFLSKKVTEFIEITKKKLQKTRAKVSDDSNRQLKKQVDKNVNVDANIMSFTFGLAARAFWAGAQWIGPTGTSHTSLSIGSFNTIKAKSSEGASEMIRQVAKSFEIQLSAMTGVIVPPANTGIPPLTFVGYK